MIKSMKVTKKSLLSRLESPSNWPKVFWGVFALAIIISLWGLVSVLPRGTHDGNIYETWLLAFDELIRAGELFPAWVKSFWFEHGSPLFVFYPPLFFYLAEIPRLLGISLVVSIKVIVGISFAISFLTMYLLAKEFWGKWGGLAAGLIYMMAPYHFALIYTRGAYAENLAYGLLPLALWFLYKIFKEGTRWQILGFAASAAAILLTNLPAFLVFVVAGIVFTIIWATQTRRFPYIDLGLGAIGALGLSAIYWLPAFLNRGLIQSEHFISGKYSFLNYFTGLSKFLPFQPWSDVSFHQWGVVGWLIVIGAIVWLWKYRKSPKKDVDNSIQHFLISLAIVLLLMTAISYPVWVVSQFMPYIQFPYRLLTVAFILIALLGAYLIYRLPEKWRLMGLALILLQGLFFSKPIYDLKHPAYAKDITHTVYGDIKAQMLGWGNAVNDEGQKLVVLHTTEVGYLPKGIDKNVLENEFYNQVKPTLESLSFESAAEYTLPPGNKILTPGVIHSFVDNAREVSFVHEHDKATRVYYRQFGFPGWEVWIDNTRSGWSASTGQVEFIVPAGEHLVTIRYDDPPGATWGRWLSLISLVLVLGIWWVSKPKRRRSEKKR